MARSLTICLFCVLAVGSLQSLPSVAPCASAAELDKKGKADAKEAMRLYKQGDYEEAAKIFLRLSIAYPDMLVFVRNLGACYYYLRRYEPALSNLRDYLHRKKDIAADDRAEVSGWVGEMERLRDQAALAAASPSTPAATTPASSSAPPQNAPQTGAPSGAPMGVASPSTPPAQPGADVTGYSSQPTFPTEGYAQNQYGAPQPGYPQYPPASSPYASPAYGGPGYPPVAGYPPSGSYPPGAQPAAAVSAESNQPSSGNGRRVAAWIVGSAGVAIAGLGVAFHVVAADKFSKVEKKYDPDVEKTGKDLQAGAIVCYVAGGAALATGIILGVTGGGSGPGVAFAPALGPDGAGAVIGGSF